jgi:hypothetical protein
MVLDTGDRISESRRPSLGWLRSGLAVLAILAVAGSWIAVQIQTACETATRDAFLGFTHTLTSGEPELVEQFFAERGSFSWFSETPHRIGDDARDRDSLGDYLRDRIEQDARLRVLFFDFNSEAPAGVLGQFGFYAVNETWDLVSGKGAVDCESGALTVLSTGSG